MSQAAVSTPTGTDFRLGRRARKAVLALHVVATGSWLGLDVGFVVLLGTAMITSDPHVAATAYQALGIVAVWPMLAAGLASLVTGVVLGLGTKYGLIRYWWVAVKLAINVVFVLLIVFALRPGVAEVADLAETAVDQVSYRDLVGPMTVGPLMLLTATVVSVVKPWGRIRRRHR